MALLNVENLQVSYGLIKAIKGISFHVDEGEIVALIGTNGAGKTTAMHAVAKLLTPDSGKIEFAGTDVTKYPAHKIVRLGMSQVPEGRRIFQELKVKDNLLLGAFSRKDKAEFLGTLEEMYSLFPILKERENQIAGTNAGGGAGDDVSSETFIARRAEHGAFAAVCRSDFRHDKENQRKRRDRLSRRAERKASAVFGGQGVCSGNGQRHFGRDGQRIIEQ